MINELISRVLCARNCAHLQHWSTNSYAEHQTLESFYTQVLDKLDALVESYQGNFGAVSPDAVPLSKNSQGFKYLEEDAIWIAENREAISQGVDALSNQLDELVSVYLKSLYKLKSLK